MLSRIAVMAAPLLCCGAVAAHQDDPLTRPIVGSRTAEWLTPRPPARIFGNTYLVGFGGLSVALIDTGKGLILVDGALPQAAPAILSNISRLGLSPRDVKFILSTEPHFDHAGGIAALARATGAVAVASPPGAEGLRTGRLAEDDPQRALDHSFPPVARLRIVRDQERLRLGNTVVTAHATPGHTMGSMSWSWMSCEGRRCRTFVFASSLNPVSAPGYRYTAPAHQAILAGFRHSFRRLNSIPCDILISAHPAPQDVRLGYNDKPGACRTFVNGPEQALTNRLAQEKTRGFR